ncbi:hypothetical protein ACWCYZ_28785 [Streptomyces virginiae]
MSAHTVMAPDVTVRPYLSTPGRPSSSNDTLYIAYATAAPGL